MKNPGSPRFLFIFGLRPEGLFFFSRGYFKNQPIDKFLAQVTHNLPFAKIKWDELKKITFLLIQGAVKPNSFKARFFFKGKGLYVYINIIKVIIKES